MKSKYLTLICLLVFGSFFALYAPVQAQIKGADLTLQISPTNPGPNENVTATLTSYVTDANKALIAWSVNNEKLSQGIGKKTFYFNTGELNTDINLSVSIDIIGVPNITKNIIITPGATDMLWEAVDSYAPPFYRGKTLVASEGEFKVVAIPSIGGAQNLSYQWKHNNKVSQASSGFGKNFMFFKNSYLDKKDSVSVIVSDIFGKQKGGGGLTLATTTPKILFYKKDKNGINMERTIEDGYNLSKAGETLVAIPYFFSPKNINSSELIFEWSLGGDTITPNSPQNEIGILPEEGKSGSSSIKLEVSNTETLFQKAKKEIIVNF